MAETVGDMPTLPPVAIRLTLNLGLCFAAGDEYTGTVAIDYSVDGSLEPTGSLLLHSDATQVELSSLRVSSGKKSAKISKITRYVGGRSTNSPSLDPAVTGDVVVVETQESLNIGVWTFEAKFKAKVRDDATGIYACVPGNKTTGCCIATHFEVTLARKAFPCIDDVFVRVPLTLTLTVPSSVPKFVAGNADEVSRTSSNGTTTVVFAETRPLPAYVCGFVFSTLEGGSKVLKQVSREVPRQPPGLVFETVDTSAIRFEVTAIGDKATATFDVAATLEYAVQSYSMQVQLLAAAAAAAGAEASGRPPDAFVLPHSTVRFVALPVMHISGMENDGLVFLQASLGDIQSKAAGKPRAMAQEALARFVAHEVAHHWFGNSVGLGFGTKEGVCLLLETWGAGRLLGRTLPNDPSTAPSAAAAAVTAASTGTRCQAGHEAAAGKELTDLTYQDSELAMVAFARWIGWKRFSVGLAALVAKHQGEYVEDDAFQALFSVV
jgi:hypothetical protein